MEVAWREKERGKEKRDDKCENKVLVFGCLLRQDGKLLEKTKQTQEGGFWILGGLDLFVRGRILGFGLYIGCFFLGARLGAVCRESFGLRFEGAYKKSGLGSRSQNQHGRAIVVSW